MYTMFFFTESGFQALLQLGVAERLRPQVGGPSVVTAVTNPSSTGKWRVFYLERPGTPT